jgi:hypothetical protein
MDVKIEADSNYKNCIYFLTEVSFHFHVENIYEKYLFGPLEPYYDFPLSL